MNDLRNQLANAQEKALEAQKAELQLRKDRRELEAQKQELELAVTRQMDEERSKIKEAAKKEASRKTFFATPTGKRSSPICAARSPSYKGKPSRVFPRCKAKPWNCNSKRFFAVNFRWTPSSRSR